MTTLLSWAFSASLLLAAALLLRLALGRFLTPAVRMALWGLVGLRLALPVTFTSPFARPGGAIRPDGACPGGSCRRSWR